MNASDRAVRVELVTGAPPTWLPLQVVQRLSAQRSEVAAVRVDDFMYMGRLEGADVVVHMYKHSDTRRYLWLDDTGHTFRPISARAPNHDHPLTMQAQACRDLVEELHRVTSAAAKRRARCMPPVPPPEASL